MSEQHIELSLIKYELPSKMLLHCVTHLAAHTNWDDKCSCGIIDGGVGIERGEMNSLSIYICTWALESQENQID
jgi:hypothetical protein